MAKPVTGVQVVTLLPTATHQRLRLPEMVAMAARLAAKAELPVFP